MLEGGVPSALRPVGEHHARHTRPIEACSGAAASVAAKRSDRIRMAAGIPDPQPARYRRQLRFQVGDNAAALATASLAGAGSILDDAHSRFPKKARTG